MSRTQVHKAWCDAMVARAKKAREGSDYPYKLMTWKGDTKNARIYAR